MVRCHGSAGSEIKTQWAWAAAGKWNQIVGETMAAAVGVSGGVAGNTGVDVNAGVGAASSRDVGVGRLVVVAGGGTVAVASPAVAVRMAVWTRIGVAVGRV